jgi:imidazole glycerol-phosphate synthase subunit HisH
VKITVADLGIGNLHSLAKALENAGAQVFITTKADDWLDAKALVLPGVGAFGAGMKPLAAVREPLNSKLLSGCPALGVCLGLQLLLERSDEDPVEGVGFITGNVPKFPLSVGKVPHMGWSPVVHKGDELFAGIPSGSYFYFVHSYYPDPEEDVGVAQTKYGLTFQSVLRKANTYATQFHPEKSGDHGQQLLKNFVKFAEEMA